MAVSQPCPCLGREVSRVRMRVVYTVGLCSINCRGKVKPSLLGINLTLHQEPACLPWAKRSCRAVCVDSIPAANVSFPCLARLLSVPGRAAAVRGPRGEFAWAGPLACSPPAVLALRGRALVPPGTTASYAKERKRALLSPTQVGGGLLPVLVSWSSNSNLET